MNTTDGHSDHEHGGEDVYGCYSSSAYFKQLHQSIKANTHVTALPFVYITLPFVYIDVKLQHIMS